MLFKVTENFLHLKFQNFRNSWFFFVSMKNQSLIIIFEWRTIVFNAVGQRVLKSLMRNIFSWRFCSESCLRQKSSIEENSCKGDRNFHCALLYWCCIAYVLLMCCWCIAGLILKTYTALYIRIICFLATSFTVAHWKHLCHLEWIQFGWFLLTLSR